MMPLRVRIARARKKWRRTIGAESRWFSFAEWRPAALVSIDIRLITWALAAVAIVRGIDYAIALQAVPARSVGLAWVEQAFGALLPIWFLVCGLLLAVGALCRVHALIFFGHGLLAAMYSVVAVGTLVPTLPYAPGIRSSFGLLFPALLQTILMIRTGPNPVSSEEATALAVIEGDDEK